MFAYKILRRGYSRIWYAPKNLRQVMKGDHARTRILAEMKKILPFLVKSGNTDFGPPGALSLPLYFISKTPIWLSWGSWGNSKFRLVYEPIEHDFELSSFWITAPNHFRALIILWLKIQTDFERYLKSDDRSSKISSCHHFRSPLQIIFELWSYPD